MAQLLYGSGLPLMECARLRIQDVDFEYRLQRGGLTVRSPLDFCLASSPSAKTNPPHLSAR